RGYQNGPPSLPVMLDYALRNVSKNFGFYIEMYTFISREVRHRQCVDMVDFGARESAPVLLFGANPLTRLGRYMRGFAAKLWISLNEAKLLKLPARTTARAPA